RVLRENRAKKRVRDRSRLVEPSVRAAQRQGLRQLALRLASPAPQWLEAGLRPESLLSRRPRAGQLDAGLEALPGGGDRDGLEKAAESEKRSRLGRVQP